MPTTRLFTSESVTEGHPDKIADAISDAVLDALLAEDPHSHAAVETVVTTGQVMVCGEVTTEAYVDIAGIARSRILDIGYDSSAKGFDGASCGVSVAIDAQSPDIAQGVTSAYETRHGSTDLIDAQGAGDQGLMFGYACTETPSLMPLPIDMAHALSLQLTKVRKEGALDYLCPDGKTQVTIRYDENDKPVAVDTVVVSSQHRDGVDIDATMTPDLRRLVIDPVLERYDLDHKDMRVLVNPTGKFVIGGPMGDAGLTGRKIIVDTYGGMARHGGGASPARTPLRSTVPLPTPCAGWPRTSSPQVWPTAASARWLTLSVPRVRWDSASTPSGPTTFPRSRSSAQSPRSSTFVPARSSRTLICFVRFTPSSSPEDTSGASSLASPGR